jgi:L-seryl-tRNA(Ser) seleniumtransferase
LTSLPSDVPHALRAQIAREAVEAARARARDGTAVSDDEVIRDAATRTVALRVQLLQPVINATGVLLHTNLGRAPLGTDVVDAMARNARYTNLEYRLADGARGSRHQHAGQLLADACGADAGMVVNNNAAAVLLVLASHARAREVVVSRGELVEIGGGFRVPEIMAETGARLVEVGTTNRTRLTDYERAVTADTALVLKVHASNYRMIGFTEATPVAQLATLALPVVVDAGSGLLDARTPWLGARPAWLRDEPGARQCLEDGAGLVTFSGDKLLGGPQAGIIVGRRELVERCRTHPLARALRADKVTLAALQQLAFAYLDHDGARIPFWHMATLDVEGLRMRAEHIASSLAGAKVVDTESVAGAGSLPGLTIPSAGIALDAVVPARVAQQLRERRIVARIEDAQVVCDLRAVAPADDARLAEALREVST